VGDTREINPELDSRMTEQIFLLIGMNGLIREQKTG
jgi:hypothetical protein